MILLALVKSLSKSILQFTINVSIKAKWINLRKPWFTKGLLNPQGRKICYISLSLITLTLPMKMHISRTKTNLLILFELLSVHIMKNKLKSYKLLGKFLIEIKASVVYHPIQRKQPIYLANDYEHWPQFSKQNSCIKSKSHNSILPPKLVNSIFLDAANEQEIIELCSTYRSGTAVGYETFL